MMYISIVMNHQKKHGVQNLSKFLNALPDEKGKNSDPERLMCFQVEGVNFALPPRIIGRTPSCLTPLLEPFKMGYGPQ